MPRSNERDLLQGPLMPMIIRFSLPLIVTNLLQVCYSAADMIVVGLSDVPGAIGAIGTTSSLVTLILNVFIGFSVGATVITARCLGARNQQGTEKAVHTALLTGAIFGVVGGIVGVAIARPVLTLMGNQGEVLRLSVLYAQIYFAGSPFLSVANYAIAIFRAKGDTATPLSVLTASGVLNVGLNLFFVLVCGMSVEGVAIATSISSAASMILLLLLLNRDKGWCKFTWKNLSLDKRAFMDILRIGLPAGLQGALFSLSNLLIQSAIIGINNQVCPGGSGIIDGNSAALSLENFPYMASNAVCQASITFTSQHYGAGKFRRIGKVMQNCCLLTCLVILIFGGSLLLFQKPLIGLYVQEGLAVETAQLRLQVLISTYFLVALMEVCSGVLRGLDHSAASTVIVLLGSCAFRIVWLYTIFQLNPTLTTIYLSYPISWILTTLVLFLFVQHYWRPLVRSEEAREAEQIAQAQENA